MIEAFPIVAELAGKERIQPGGGAGAADENGNDQRKLQGGDHLSLRHEPGISGS